MVKKLLHAPSPPSTWTPSESTSYDAWLSALLSHSSSKPLHPTITHLSNLMSTSTRLTQLSNAMYLELLHRPIPPGPLPYTTSIISPTQMLQALNTLITLPILWSTYRYLIGWTSCPILSLFWRPLHTVAGFAFFQDPTVNLALKGILDIWGQFLRSSESAWCLGTGENCWFGPDALKHLVAEASGQTSGKALVRFEDIYECSPEKEGYGFRSWDEFFTRRFKAGIRPVAYPDDTSVLVHACESIPRYIKTGVQLRDTFWAKGTPYSLTDMLDHDESASLFVGGTVYQAYLSALSYHRWHSPTSGTIVKTRLIPGLYFSEPPTVGFNPDAVNGEYGMTWNNAYQSNVATRAVFWIQSDCVDLGLMVVMFIGLTEVSTCEIFVSGGRVEKGQEIGAFHCGGSTYGLVFREGVDVADLPSLDEEGKGRGNFHVNGFLGRVKAKGKKKNEGVVVEIC